MYDEGSDVVVFATPGTDACFSHWELDGVFFSLDNPATVSMDADHSLTAVFYDFTDWYRTYDGGASDAGNHVIVDSGGDIVVVGTTEIGGTDKTFIAKYGFDGDRSWLVPHTGESADELYTPAAVAEADSGYVVAGTSTRYYADLDMYQLLTGTAGNMVSDVVYQYPEYEPWVSTVYDQIVSSMKKTSDNHYITVMTWIEPSGDSHINLRKTDDQGNTILYNYYPFDHDYTEKGLDVIQTSDGGYVIVGSTDRLGHGGDLYLIKVDHDLNLLWSKNYGGVGADQGNSVIQCSDGGFIITGYTTAKDQDLYVVKTDSNGDFDWAESYGGSGEDSGTAIIHAHDSGYVISGYTEVDGNLDVYFLKISETGTVLAESHYGGSGDEKAVSVAAASDGGYVLFGETSSLGSTTDAFLLKLSGASLEVHVKGDGTVDPEEGTHEYPLGSQVKVTAMPGADASFSHWELDGEYYSTDNPTTVDMDTGHILLAVFCGPLNWQTTFGGNSYDCGYDVVYDGGYRYVTGIYSGPEYEWDVFLNKYDSGGDLVWSQIHTGEEDEWNTGMELVKLGDGFAIAGGSGSYTNSDFYLLRMGLDGSKSWDTTVGGAEYDEAEDMVAATGGGFVLTGLTESTGAGGIDVYLVKITDGGSVLWERTYGGANDDRGFGLAECSDGGFIVAGVANRYTPDQKIYLVKTFSDGTLDWETQIGDSGYETSGGDIIALSDGYLIVGYIAPSGGDSDVYLVKTDLSGVVEWTETYGGPDDDCGNSITALSGGGYAIAGFTYTGSDMDTYVIIVDSEGDILASATYGGTGNENASEIAETEDGYVVTTYTKSFSSSFDVYVLDIPTLYEEEELIITVEGSGTTDPPSGVYSYPSGFTVTVQASPEAGWGLSHWEVDGVPMGTAPSKELTLDGPHTLTAVYAQSPLLTIEVQGQGTTSWPPFVYSFANYPPNPWVPVDSTPDDCWEFSHWILDGLDDGTDSATGVTMDMDHTLIAVFTPYPELTIQVQGHGTTSPPPGMYAYPSGSSVILGASASHDYRFSYWAVDGVRSGTDASLNIIMDADHVATAVFNRVRERKPKPLPEPAIEDMTPLEAAEYLSGKTPKKAASMLTTLDPQREARIMEEMDPGFALTVLTEMNPSTAEKTLLNCSAAGGILEEAVDANETERITQMLLEFNQTSSASLMLSMNPEYGASLVETIAEADMTGCAEIVEAAVKLRAESLTDERRREITEQLTKVIESSDTGLLADIFLEIARLPETPSTVAELFTLMPVDQATEILCKWITDGALNETCAVMKCMNMSCLNDVYTLLTVEERSAIYPFMDSETVRCIDRALLPLPDLAIDETTIQRTSPLHYSVHISVINSGNTCSGESTVTLESESMKTTATVPPLETNERQTVELDWSPDSVGDYTLTLVVIQDGEEIEYDDNAESLSHSVTLPDLYIETGQLAECEALVEKTIEVKVTSAYEPIDHTAVWFLVEGEKQSETPINMLGEGEITTLTFRWTPPEKGDYALEFMVDPGDEVTETMESNNVAKLTAHVTPNKNSQMITYATVVAALLALAVAAYILHHRGTI
ncbi:hypothetical protein JXL21_00280 [Candidatus Bathyarchaeota archaeon]|nr:hypothetical protein [Candidatus Bathyarchaeota archaeon]